jgi:cold shock CspA family protein
MTEHAQNNDVVTSNVSRDVSRVTGCVKWFNNKAGYGFITVSSGFPHSGDVFVHHSAINVGEEQYRFLVQGEYVEFDCVPVENGPHQWQASNVTGPSSGRLMCETRRAMRSTRPSHTESDDHVQSQSREWQQPPPRRQSHQQSAPSSDQHRPDRPPRHQSGPPRVRRQPSGEYDGRQPRSDEYEWLLVRKYPQGSRPPVRRVRRVVDSQE